MSRYNLAIAEFPALRECLAAIGVTLVDVGGRGAALPALRALAPVSHYVTCEPDADEARRLEQQLPQETDWRAITVLPTAIGSQSGRSPLYLTQQAGMSSLLEPNLAVAKNFYLAHKFHVAATSEVTCMPLDAAAKAYRFEDACFLKVDTQGSELDILQSGTQLLRESLLGVHVECSFRQFYRGQALFADVDRFLRDAGFELFTLNRTNLRRIGFQPASYSARITAWAHCLYLREPETIPETVDAGPRLLRLLGLALSFQHFDLARQITDLLAGFPVGPPHGALVSEVERWIARETERLERRARRDGTLEKLLSAALRDRKQLE